ncbi:MAG: tRNA 2-thiouridine(34) synthase MnmA [Gammaproteobacteria bacterium]|nr:tRNA 2-thiouridine(34) synthase MnmA [Gammaproteobacteria bacterium]
MSMKNIIVGMSGGVDSSVAGHLLKQQGYHVEGLFMKNWEEDDSYSHCASAEDTKDAKSVCESLDIPLHTRNFATEYWDNVFEHFLDEYARGRTPNPDILCNREVKFKTFLEHAIELGAEGIATGHYARIRKTDGKFQLVKGKDHNKDQSYFLYTLGQKQLAHSLFPLGELDKPEVREIAKQLGLVTHDKKDSTGICFIGERNFKEFLSQYLPAQPGEIQTTEGNVIARHDGLMYYTLGQRQGLGIGGLADYNDEPWYVVDKDLENNILIVAQGHDHPRLYKNALEANELHWVSGEVPNTPFKCKAKTRYRQPDQDCTITQLDNDRCYVEFDKPQRAITPGQSVVFYQDETCLGGGIIDKAINI